MYEIFRISYDGLVMTKPCQSPLLRLHPDTDAPPTAINTYCFPALRHRADDRAENIKKFARLIR
jgi:hypothetical protein